MTDLSFVNSFHGVTSCGIMKSVVHETQFVSCPQLSSVSQHVPLVFRSRLDLDLGEPCLFTGHTHSVSPSKSIVGLPVEEPCTCVTCAR